MDRRAWEATVHGVEKSQTQLSTAQHATDKQKSWHSWGGGGFVFLQNNSPSNSHM